VSFAVAGVSGTIDHTASTVKVILPAGTNLTQTPAVVVSDEASYSPAGQQTFSGLVASPKTYTVTSLYRRVQKLYGRCIPQTGKSNKCKGYSNLRHAHGVLSQTKLDRGRFRRGV
jgi:hypothetical protein